MRLTFKTPDVLDQLEDQFLDMDEQEREAWERLINKYVKYGEYITIDFDLSSQTGIAVR